MPEKDLTHFDDRGRPRMVDVSGKPATRREAVAEARVRMAARTRQLVESRSLAKGDVTVVAELAGTMGAKRTSDLIPLCHPLPISKIDLDFEFDDSLTGIIITSTVKVTGKTGVEMEALTAVSVAALTIYDMAKAAEKTMKIQNIRLIEKHGGASGDIVNE